MEWRVVCQLLLSPLIRAEGCLHRLFLLALIRMEVCMRKVIYQLFLSVLILAEKLFPTFCYQLLVRSGWLLITAFTICHDRNRNVVYQHVLTDVIILVKGYLLAFSISFYTKQQGCLTSFFYQLSLGVDMVICQLFLSALIGAWKLAYQLLLSVLIGVGRLFASFFYQF